MSEATETYIKKQFPLKKAPEGVNDYLKKLDPDSRIAIACSGGADSIFLTLWFCAHFRNQLPNIILLHFNHATRSTESDMDQSFVHEFGRSLQLEVFSEKRKTRSSKNSEDDLRKDRFSFFQSVFDKENIQTLLTGHHLMDKIETMLMRLSRGSGLDGIVAPQPIQKHKNNITYLRPLIYIQKEKILTALKKTNQKWKEDLSNNETLYYRNYIRHDLLPNWENRCPQNFFENMGTSCSLLQEDADALNRWAHSTVESHGWDSNFPLSQIKMLPIAIKRRSLLLWLNHHGIAKNLTHDLMTRLLHAQNNERFNLSEQQYLETNSNGDLRIAYQPLNKSFQQLSYLLPTNNTIFFPGGKCLTLKHVESDQQTLSDICLGKDNPSNRVHLHWEQKWGNPFLKIVFWANGMTYQPLGLKHEKKLQDCFVDRKIPNFERRKLPVVMNNKGEILWVPGLPPSEKARVKRDSKQLLRLTYS